MNSGDFHRDEEAPEAMSSPPFLPCPELLKLASAGDGLAGSIRDGGVFEEVVNLVSRVSTEKSLPAYCRKLMTCCWTLRVPVMEIQQIFGSRQRVIGETAKPSMQEQPKA